MSKPGTKTQKCHLNVGIMQLRRHGGILLRKCGCLSERLTMWGTNIMFLTSVATSIG